MNRILASLSLAALLAAPAAAQCFSTADPGTPTGTVGDDAISGHIPLGLTYPNLVGAAVLAGGYTHVRVCTNGWAMLTDGTSNVGLPATSSYGSTANTNAGIGGGALGQPLLMAWWGDGNLYPTNSPVGTAHQPAISVKASTGPGVPAEITWLNHSDFGGSTTKKNFKALIYDSGAIEYQYSKSHVQTGASARYVGVTARNGATPVPPVSDLSVGGVTADKTMYQTFTSGTNDLHSLSLLFVPDLTLGGWTETVICTGSGVGPAPAVAGSGVGCYTIPAVPHDTFYQQFNDFTSAATALTGNSLTLTPISSPPGYLAVWNAGGGSAYFPPTSATGTVTSLAVSDDGSNTIAPSVAMASPFGASASLTISHNGILTLGATANQGTDFSPTGAEICTFNGAGAFYSWADFRDNNTTPVASGVIKYYEETVLGDQILYVTWDAVDRWASPQVTNANTWQFQANLTTGQVNIVWSSMNPNSTSTFTGGNNCVVGYSAPGVSGNPGSIDLATVLTVTTFPDVPAVAPMTIAVNTPPGLGTLGETFPMTWTVTNVPEASHILPTLRACNIVFSIGFPAVAAYDLGATITPPNGPSGCNGYVATVDALVDISAFNGTGICTTTIPFVFAPPPSLVGVVITTQAIALAPPGVYLGNTNDIGGHSLWSSPAVQQTYQQL